MRQRLLKIPQNDGQIIFLPDLQKFFSQLNNDAVIGTAHQPYFFNPGVSLKFIFLENLTQRKKKIIFVDTDRVCLRVNVPTTSGTTYPRILIDSQRALYDYLAPTPDKLLDFFSSLEGDLKKAFGDSNDILSNFLIFKEIITNQKGKYLKEILTESFLKFYGLGRNYNFISDFIRSSQFKNFFIQIYKDNQRFQEIFNETLDDYRRVFRFRYKNFPFPKLENGELAFWIFRDGIRYRCFKKDLDLANYAKHIIFPRALTLTIFLRLYELDFFIHGIGGANYEWVGDRIIEKFFKKKIPDYGIVSGTFLLGNNKERFFPYFFIIPRR